MTLTDGTRYAATMAFAEDLYSDVIDALRRAEVPAEITQTGGMCLAITFPHPAGGRFLLTDAEDTLSWSPDDEDGWCLGYYPTDDAVYSPDEDCRYWYADVKAPETAIELTMRALRETQEHR